MLVLSRKISERILIGDDIVITVVRIGSGVVSIGVDAPLYINIARPEIALPGNEKPASRIQPGPEHVSDLGCRPRDVLAEVNSEFDGDVATC